MLTVMASQPRTTTPRSSGPFPSPHPPRFGEVDRTRLPPSFMLTALPAFSDNYIWLLEDQHRNALVVDPGDPRPVIAAIEAGSRLAAVLITHHHADHIGGLAALRERYRFDCYGPADPRVPGPIERLSDGDVVEIGALRFRVLEVPGHTRGHIAFHGEGLLFCGDTLFSLGCGRLFEGSPAQMRASLDRLAALPGDTLVCCAHEYTEANAAFAAAADPDNPALHARSSEVRRLRAVGRATVPSTIAEERACNPFLRCREPALRAAAAARLGRPPADDDETFAALRAWKDEFRS